MERSPQEGKLTCPEEKLSCIAGKIIYLEQFIHLEESLSVRRKAQRLTCLEVKLRCIE
jgi:hypothetical protein